MKITTISPQKVCLYSVGKDELFSFIKREKDVGYKNV